MAGRDRLGNEHYQVPICRLSPSIEQGVQRLVHGYLVGLSARTRSKIRVAKDRRHKLFDFSSDAN
jgi:hypothetical protein